MTAINYPPVTVTPKSGKPFLVYIDASVIVESSKHLDKHGNKKK